MTYKEELEYFESQYILEPPEGGKWEDVCTHNSEVARKIGKNNCSEFWEQLFTLAFPTR